MQGPRSGALSPGTFPSGRKETSSRIQTKALRNRRKRFRGAFFVRLLLRPQRAVFRFSPIWLSGNIAAAEIGPLFRALDRSRPLAHSAVGEARILPRHPDKSGKEHLTPKPFRFP